MEVEAEEVEAGAEATEVEAEVEGEVEVEVEAEAEMEEEVGADNRGGEVGSRQQTSMSCGTGWIVVAGADPGGGRVKAGAPGSKPLACRSAISPTLPISREVPSLSWGPLH